MLLYKTNINGTNFYKTYNDASMPNLPHTWLTAGVPYTLLTMVKSVTTGKEGVQEVRLLNNGNGKPIVYPSKVSLQVFEGISCARPPLNWELQSRHYLGD